MGGNWSGKFEVLWLPVCTAASISMGEAMGDLRPLR